MKFDFTTYYDRHNFDSVAVDNPNNCDKELPLPLDGFQRIPMWIADMNFATYPGIVDKMTQRVQHPLYGYFKLQQEYFQQIMWWHEVSFGTNDLQSEHIAYENSVLGGLMSALGAVCQSGEKVLIHSPTYNGFTASIDRAGYRLIHSELVLDHTNIWRMNLQEMEELIKTHHIHCFVFCSPHNPSGRVWEKEELTQLMNLCKKYDVTVISDEIWSSFLLFGHEHIPTTSISEDAKQRTISLYAPSKTFNLAGLIGGYRVVYNPTLRDKVEHFSNLSQYNHANVLTIHALLAAYTQEGFLWTQELLKVIEENILYTYDFFTEKVKGVSVSKPQGTYLVYINCEQWLSSHHRSLDWLLEQGFLYGIIWKDGRAYHGDSCIRINVALPVHVVQDAVHRMDKYIFNSEHL